MNCLIKFFKLLGTPKIWVLEYQQRSCNGNSVQRLGESRKLLF
nr:MAG TPA: hypothetical protein [Crassvirales sp.]